MDDQKREEDKQILSVVQEALAVVRMIAERKPVGRAPQPEPSGAKVISMGRKSA